MVLVLVHYNKPFGNQEHKMLNKDILTHDCTLDTVCVKVVNILIHKLTSELFLNGSF